MANVFISYKSEDKEYAESLSTLLQRRGFTVWWDAELVPAEKYPQRIKEEIEAAQAVIVLWSQKSVESKFVLGEAKLADEANKLIQARIDKCDPPYYMNSDVHVADLSEWIPGNNPSNIHGLLEAVERLVAPNENLDILKKRIDALEENRLKEQANFKKILKKYILASSILALGVLTTIFYGYKQLANIEKDNINRRVVETYYRPDKPEHFNRHNVKGIDKLEVGRYRVHFTKPFKNNYYIAVANNTAGYVSLTGNTVNYIDLISYDNTGNEVDAEIFFLAYGE